MLYLLHQQELNKTANSVRELQEAMLIICHCSNITKTENKKAIGYIGMQGQLFKNSKLINTSIIMLIIVDQEFILKVCLQIRKEILSA